MKGEVLTTPFSFIATTSSLLWEGLTPVFVDIDQETLNINEGNIKKYINNNTSAIVPVHVFGNPCNANIIDSIAKQNNLKVIYDASHTFGVELEDKNILTYGDISTISFHATKFFHTIEGGALIVNDDKLAKKIRKLINFGINDNGEITEVGINAKMNEFEAAMGLSTLDNIEFILERRKNIFEIYYNNLNKFVTFQKMTKDATKNYNYCPIIFDSEEILQIIIEKLNKKGIYPKRYFYPSLNTLELIQDEQICPNSEDLSKRILCLPLHVDLDKNTQNTIINTIINIVTNRRT